MTLAEAEAHIGGYAVTRSTKRLKAGQPFELIRVAPRQGSTSFRPRDMAQALHTGLPEDPMNPHLTQQHGFAVGDTSEFDKQGVPGSLLPCVWTKRDPRREPVAAWGVPCYETSSEIGREVITFGAALLGPTNDF